MGAGSLDVIKPSAAGLVATAGAGRRPPPRTLTGPAGGQPGGGRRPAPVVATKISIGMLRHQSLNHPSAKVFSTSLINPLNISNASVLYSTRGSFCPQER